MIEVRCFHSFAEAAFLRDEVNALNRLSARADPFSTFDFFENFFRHDEFFPAGLGLRVWFLTAFCTDRLIGYLALKQTTQKVMGVQTSSLSFFVAHDTDRPHLVAAPDRLSQVTEAFYIYLLSRKQDWSLLELQQQDDVSPLYPPPAAVARQGYLVREWPSMETFAIHIRWSTLREYYKALSKKFRTNVARQMRHLFAEGNVELLGSSDPATTPALFELYCSIEPHSWKAQANANIGRHPERIEYFKGLLDARQPMRVSIQVLLLDGMPIAGLISGAFLTGLYALHIVYDNRLSRLAPGSAMLLMGMRQAIGGKYAFFNLLSGFGYYKVRWLAETTVTRTAQIYRAGSVMFWHRIFGDCRRWILLTQSKETRRLFNPARRNASEREETQLEPEKIPELHISAAEREHNRVLIAAIRESQCEFLSSTQLAAIMPFETQRIPEAKTLRGN